jgi:hypothetical protein
LATVRKERERYVSLALTVIRAWIVADSPATNCKPLASFGQWSDWVRQALLWLGFADPAECVFEQLAQDPDRETLGRLLHAWEAGFGHSPTMIREAVTAAKSSFVGTELLEVLFEIADHRGEINNTRLGKWINRHQGRIVDGLRFVKASGTTSAVRWFVKAVASGRSGMSCDFGQNTESVTDLFEAESQLHGFEFIGRSSACIQAANTGGTP